MFKSFLDDTGSLSAMGMGNIQVAILRGNVAVNMGGILENVFATQLVANGFQLRYMDKNKLGEIDVVVQEGVNIIPVEIKSGKNYITHAALDKVLDVPAWNLNEAIVFCGDNVKQASKITYMP